MCFMACSINHTAAELVNSGEFLRFSMWSKQLKIIVGNGLKTPSSQIIICMSSIHKRLNLPLLQCEILQLNPFSIPLKIISVDLAFTFKSQNILKHFLWTFVNSEMDLTPYMYSLSFHSDNSWVFFVCLFWRRRKQSCEQTYLSTNFESILDKFRKLIFCQILWTSSNACLHL